MGLNDEQVDTVIEAYVETVDGLKADVDKYREDALKLPDVQKELNDLKAAGDGGLQKALDDLQKKYDDDAAAHKTELETLKGQLAERDGKDALAKAISGYNEGKGIKFTSNGARTSFESAWTAKKLPLKDGALDNEAFKAFVTEYQKSDPDTFASDKPAARFAGPVGVGGKPAEQESVGAMYAKQFNAQYAQTPKKE